ncbi:hypothetical protein EQP59_10160 [Ornithobacterium rhinotracheale]|uniref:Uncharacterized protein n=2 Tax=Ornithobacterium rhinotracheale TaxID=28251 RepID=A0A410JUG3_ORNRH|nr:hypothetical protein EQP59_10160 [Ornithobacterium rhinotracheale]
MTTLQKTRTKVFLEFQNIIIMENGNMKWFEQAIGKEKIIHMFNGNIDVNEIYLHKILCYDYRLTILFHILNIPPVFPNKWNDKDFNAISMQLSFSDVSCINIYGNNLFNKMGTLNINVDENVVKMSLKGDEINIICESNFYFIDNITPEFINIEESTN